MEINNLSNQQLVDYYNSLIAQNLASQNITNNAVEGLVQVNNSQSVQDINTLFQNAMLEYLNSKQADTNSVIQTFNGYQYTSNKNAALIDGSALVNPRSYVVGALVIDPQINELAGTLFKSNANNFSVGDWRAIVEQAILANGGLGNSEDGFLAWSKDGHFVRLRNINLTPEQNQKLASMSLEFGWPVEDLPSSKEENLLSDEGKIVELDNKIAEFETKIANFRQDPQNDFTVKYGKQRFKVTYDESTGMFASTSYKVRSGIKGWFDKNVSKISKGLGIVKKIFSFIPGWGHIVSACANITQKFSDFYKSKNSQYTS